VDAGVVRNGFVRVTPAAGLFRKPEREFSHRVRVSVFSVTVRTRGGPLVAAAPGAAVKIFRVARDRSVMTLPAIHRNVGFEVGNIVVLRAGGVAVEAIVSPVYARLENIGNDRHATAVAGDETGIAVAVEAGLRRCLGEAQTGGQHDDTAEEWQDAPETSLRAFHTRAPIVFDSALRFAHPRETAGTRHAGARPEW
jgi:hypothetical protein